MSIVRYQIGGKTVLCKQVGGLNDTNLVSLQGFLSTLKRVSAVIKTAYHEHGSAGHLKELRNTNLPFIIMKILYIQVLDSFQLTKIIDYALWGYP